MGKDKDMDMSLSRTFRMVEGRLEMADPVIAAGPGGDVAGSNPLGLVRVIDAKYQVLELVGQGGMGAVYRVLHLNLNKEVALKTFRSAQVDADAWARFQREAVAISKLTHVNIIQVFDFGIADRAFPYYTMELLSGQSLAEKLALVGRLEPAEAIAIFSAVAAGLAHAHRQGIVHRDIKPGNIFLERAQSGQTPKIVDFGLAKLMQSQSFESQSVTREGLIFGSPLYMSPEQSLGQATDKRTDIYSFGCSLFQALTGNPPFVGDNALATIMMHQTQAPPQLVAVVGADLVFPARLEAMMAKLLAKDPQKRFQTFEQVAEELARVADGLKGTRGSSHSVSGSAPARAAIGEQEQSGRLAAGNIFTTSGPAFRVLAVILLLFALGGGLALYLNAGLQKTKSLPKIAEASAPQVAQLAPGQDPPDLVPSEYIVRATAGGGRIFDCPTIGDGLGSLDWQERSGVKAVGRVSVPSGATVRLTCGRYLSQHPKLLRGFRPYDLFGFVWNLPLAEEHLKELHYLAGVRYLDLDNTDINGDGIKYLKPLTAVQSFHCSVTELEGKDLVAWPGLKRLIEFDGSALRRMRPAIDVLVQNPHLRLLSLKSCHLNDDDMEAICKCRRLTHLFVDFNDITMKGFRHVEALQNLEKLQVVGIVLTSDSIKTFAKLKRLKQLRINLTTWSAADKVLLHRAVPGCYIDEYRAKNPAEDGLIQALK